MLSLSPSKTPHTSARTKLKSGEQNRHRASISNQSPGRPFPLALQWLPNPLPVPGMKVAITAVLNGMGGAVLP